MSVTKPEPDSNGSELPTHQDLRPKTNDPRPRTRDRGLKSNGRGALKNARLEFQSCFTKSFTQFNTYV